MKWCPTGKKAFRWDVVKNQWLPSNESRDEFLSSSLVFPSQQTSESNLRPQLGGGKAVGGPDEVFRGEQSNEKLKRIVLQRATVAMSGKAQPQQKVGQKTQLLVTYDTYALAHRRVPQCR